VLSFCKLRFSYAHPTLSKDGKTLYFIANIRGGKETTKGGSDIFKVDVLGDNEYGDPKNLGSKVNSYSREMFPFISADNTLYFASNRPGGYGGFDIYKSAMDENGVFVKAKKLPKPLNSVKDDFSLITFDNGTSGFLVSKRPKGKGDDDIYYFKTN
jgi:Tol biopolymer transport system component